MLHDQCYKCENKLVCIVRDETICEENYRRDAEAEYATEYFQAEQEEYDRQQQEEYEIRQYEQQERHENDSNSA